MLKIFLKTHIEILKLYNKFKLGVARMKKIIIFLLLLLIPSTFATLEDNLTAFYEFNGNGTDKANSYDATSIVGVTEALASDCKRNTCYNFDGTTSDLIKLPSAIVNNKQEGTLNVWVRVQDTGSVQRNLFAKDSAGFRSQLASTNNRKPYFYLIQMVICILVLKLLMITGL